MSPVKRRSRARRRAKSMRLVKKGVPHKPSKWGVNVGQWDGQGLTPGEVQSVRKKARRTKILVHAEYAT